MGLVLWEEGAGESFNGYSMRVKNKRVDGTLIEGGEAKALYSLELAPVATGTN